MLLKLHSGKYGRNVIVSVTFCVHEGVCPPALDCRPRGAVCYLDAGRELALSRSEIENVALLCSGDVKLKTYLFLWNAFELQSAQK